MYVTINGKLQSSNLEKDFKIKQIADKFESFGQWKK